MEYGNTYDMEFNKVFRDVLILVLMEYGNTAGHKYLHLIWCLNPCSNGIRKYSL